MLHLTGICDHLEHVWYVQGQMVAEIWVQRGTTYRLQSYGGINHPLYVTSEPIGGFIEKPFSEQAVRLSFVTRIRFCTVYRELLIMLVNEPKAVCKLFD